MQGLHPRLYECPPSYYLDLPALLGSGVALREPSFAQVRVGLGLGLGLG